MNFIFPIKIIIYIYTVKKLLKNPFTTFIYLVIKKKHPIEKITSIYSIVDKLTKLE